MRKLIRLILKKCLQSKEKAFSENLSAVVTQEAEQVIH